MSDAKKGGKPTDATTFFGRSSLPTRGRFAAHDFMLVDFMMGGTAATISKTAAAPIERVKLVIQNQGAMISAGRLDRPYTGITNCFKRIYVDEGVKSCMRFPLKIRARATMLNDLTVWRGNGTNVLRYFPTQALNFAFKDYFKKMFGFSKSDGFGIWVAGEFTGMLHLLSFSSILSGNILSGAGAGASSSVFVYSLD